MNKLCLFVPEILQARKSTAVRVAGIDLGTTNSTTTEMLWSPEQPGSLKARCLELPQRCSDGAWVKSTLVPSVVAIQDEGVFIGQGAKRLRSRSLELGLLQNRDLFYECKNDMGVRKTYARAPEGFRSAAEVSGRVLGLLHDALRHESPAPVSRTVVTVPASFQVAQRRDTMAAIRLAGIDPDACDLLDEPVAAFLDYFMLHRQAFLEHAGRHKNLVVFDFGGGTCDVAVFDVFVPDQGFPVAISPRAVSRYHRLGGGDIDRAIVHEVLIPRLRSAADLGPFDLGYDDKKECLEPALLGLAEDLKIRLCDELARLAGEGGPAPPREKIAGTAAGIFSFSVRGRQLVLNCPQLTAADFDRLLDPFLDRDLLYARETEYRMIHSVFAPLQDALDRARLDPADVDYCLMLGGSSRIPRVIAGVQAFAKNAAMLTYADAAALQTAIARGAAFHGLTLELFGRGLVQPVAYERIALRTQTGTVELLPRGAALPFPAGRLRYKKLHDIAVPATSLTRDLELQVEVVAGDEGRSLYRSVWRIPAPVNRGDPLCIRYRCDETQMLDLCLMLEDAGAAFADTIENPLTHVVNPHTAMVRALELEEQIAAPGLSGPKAARLMYDLGDQYAELGHRERAIAVLKKALAANGGPDEDILNRLGMCCRDIGDYERAEKFYREAAGVTGWTGPLFNLALMQRSRGRHREAAATLDSVLEKIDTGPYLVLRAQLAADAGDGEGHAALLGRAFEQFAALPSLSDWALGWYLTGAEAFKDAEKTAAAKAEQKRRQEKQDGPGPCPEAVLPLGREGLQLKMQFA